MRWFGALLVAVWLTVAAIVGAKQQEQKQGQAAPPQPAVQASIVVPAESCEVVDGDTLRLAWKYHFAARVEGIDTPEIHDETQRAAGEVAKAAAERWIANAKDLQVRVLVADKYGGRYRCEIASRDGTLTDYMLREKLAKPYHGEAKPPWTATELQAIERWRPD